MPFEIWFECFNRNSLICFCDGLIISKRILRASWNVIEPDIASLVLVNEIRDSLSSKFQEEYIRKTYNFCTSLPFPQKLANSSIPSSVITVESTSKHTISDFFSISLASRVFLLSWSARMRKYDYLDDLNSHLISWNLQFVIIPLVRIIVVQINLVSLRPLLCLPISAGITTKLVTALFILMLLMIMEMKKKLNDEY